MAERSTSPLSAAKLALAVRQLRSERPDFSLLASDPIAVVGIGCRFPGGVKSAEDYWRLLREGIDAVTTIPADRWDAERYYDADAQTAGKTNSRWGGFVSDVDKFDPLFFGIAPREAASMDPQQRLLLEVAWEAIWDSGRSVESLAGKPVGVFVAAYNSDYPRMLFKNSEAIGPHTLSGSSHCIASGRISFLLDLRGPCVSLDTGCSSSLVAVHLACQSLRAGESKLALAGGVTLHLTPEHYIATAKLGMLAPDGRCKTFDSRANGFVPGDGCGVVVLKLLGDALQDGDRIYAVIRGTAVNEDGRTNVLTAPSGLAQREVIRAALRNAQVSPESISFVETHGTGTALGDPIEVEALTEAIGGGGPDAGRCALGAVKTNLGHLEAAAGVAGLIKAALSLDREEIPRNLHFREVNPHITLEGTRFYLPNEVTPWSRGGSPRFAGVSSFGFGGTNAHAVLEESPKIPVRRRSGNSDARKKILLPLSARSKEALRDAARLHREFLLSTEHAPAESHDICHSAAMRRDHYEERLAVVAASREECAELLGDFVAGRQRRGVAAGRAQENEGVVFVFSGQGSQWPRMGMGLFEQEPIFRAAITECDERIARIAGWRLLDELRAGEENSRLQDTEIAQPAIFAVEVALARLWQSWGVMPIAVIGHSAGEVAAANVAGVLDLDEAIRIVLHRGRIMQAATGLGKMAAVRLKASTVAEQIRRFGDKVSIAAVNGPESSVVSGESGAIEELMRQWAREGIGCRALPVNYAFHSAQMQPFSEELMRVLGTVATRPPVVPIISTVRRHPGETASFDAKYWGENVRRPVLFAAAVKAALEMRAQTFLEVGPHPVLLNDVGDCCGESVSREHLIPSLQRGHDETSAILASLGKLYCAGARVNWRALYPDPAAPVSLPTYPYQRQRFWIDRQQKVNNEVVAPAVSIEARIYGVNWRPARSLPRVRRSSETWRIVCEEPSQGERLAAALESRGQRAVVAASGNLRSAGDRADWVIYLAGGLPQAQPNADPVSCLSALTLVQELMSQFGEQSPRLCLVTQGVMAVTGDDRCAGVSQAPLWGLARTIALENPELHCRRFDLDSAAPDFEGLADEIIGDVIEDEVAIRASGRYVPRLELHTPHGFPSAPKILPDATYLTTGGLGAIGLSMAEWMVGQGARNLLLIGRSTPSPHVMARIDGMRRAGARIEVRSVDVSQRAQLESLWREMESSLPPLRGIFHAAGVVDDGVIVQQTEERFRRVLAPKVAGAWNLHELSAKQPLDFFVLFSSVASVTGSPGQGSYAAGNAFLDALAGYRCRMGLPALSINWGAWAEGGMAARVEAQGRRRVLAGVRPMSSRECLACFEVAFRENNGQLVIADMDWSRWENPPSLVSTFVARDSALCEDEREGILEQLENAPVANRRRVLLEFLRAEALRALGSSEAQFVDEREPFLKMGFDSLMAVEFRNRLSAALKRPLVATLVFDYPTLGRLVDHLLPRDLSPQPEAGDPLADDVGSLTDAQAEELLKEELGRS